MEVETPIQEDSAMPDVQISPTAETRDYLNITETADRSRLAVKTLYNWISLGRLGPREGVCHVGRKFCDSLAHV